MAKYKVIAYSATAGRKVFKGGEIVDESNFTTERLQELLKDGFIVLYDDKEKQKEQNDKKDYEEAKKRLEVKV